MYGLKPVPFRGWGRSSFEVLFLKGTAFRPSIITARNAALAAEGPSAESRSFMLDELNCFE
jgi:hypothetical protein